MRSDRTGGAHSAGAHSAPQRQSREPEERPVRRSSGEEMRRAPRQAEPQRRAPQRADYDRQPPRRKKKKTSPLVIIAVIILILALAVLGFAAKTLLGGKGGNIEKAAPAPAIQAVPAAQSVAADDEPEVMVAAVEKAESEYGSSMKQLSVNDRLFDVRAYSGDSFYAISHSTAGELLYVIANNGVATPMSAYVQLPAKTNTEGKQNFYSDSTLEGIAVRGNSIVTLENVYSGWDDPETGYAGTSQLYIRTLDSTGKELSCSEFINQGGEYVVLSSVKIGPDGYLYLVTDSGIAVTGTDGKVVRTIQTDGYVSTLRTLKDGRIAACVWTADGLRVFALDSSTASLTEVFALPDGAYSVYDGFGGYDLYYNQGADLYGCTIADGSVEKLFNWPEMAVVGDYVTEIAGNDTTFCAMQSYVNTDGSFRNDIAMITRYEEGKGPKVNTLVMASAVGGLELQMNIADYNRSGNSSRIKLVTVDSGYENIIDSIQQYAVAELDGAMPDLIDMTGISYYEFASKGIAQDLTSYINKTAELMPGVRNALTVNGGIYEVSPGFSVSTVIGDADIVGTNGTWNFEEYKAALGKMDPECMPFGMAVTGESIVYNSAAMNMAEIVNWNEGTADFNNANFIDGLLVAATLPKDEYELRVSPEALFEERMQMLVQATLFDYDDILSAGAEFGERASIVGYPVENGSGNVLNLVPGVAMSAASKNKDAAWSFMSRYLSADYQRNMWHFPSVKSVFEAGLAEAKNDKYMTDENGQQIKVARAYVYDSLESGTVREVYALTDTDVAKLQNLVDSASRMSDSSVICDIAVRNAAAFLNGECTAEEAAAAAQAQADVYLNSIK